MRLKADESAVTPQLTRAWSSACTYTPSSNTHHPPHQLHHLNKHTPIPHSASFHQAHTTNHRTSIHQTLHKHGKSTPNLIQDHHSLSRHQPTNPSQPTRQCASSPNPPTQPPRTPPSAPPPPPASTTPCAPTSRSRPPRPPNPPPQAKPPSNCNQPTRSKRASPTGARPKTRSRCPHSAVNSASRSPCVVEWSSALCALASGGRFVWVAWGVRACMRIS